MSCPVKYCVTTSKILSILNKSSFSFHHNSTKSLSGFQFVKYFTTTSDEKNVKNLSHEVIAKVNDQITKGTHGRLFAVIHLAGHQYKITTEDIVVVRGHWPGAPGDEIRLEKVLLVGSSDFTLIGRPLLPLDQVSVLATVIEKTLSHTYPIMRFVHRKNNMKLNFFKDEMSYLRITSINLTGTLNNLGDTDGLKNRIF